MLKWLSKKASFGKGTIFGIIISALAVAVLYLVGLFSADEVKIKTANGQTSWKD